MTTAITAITQNIPEAVRLLGVYTAGSFNVWDLSGSQKSSCRAHIMSHLLKGNMRPGVPHLQTVLFKVAGIKPRRREMDVDAEKKLIQWCQDIESQQDDECKSCFGYGHFRDSGVVETERSKL